MITKEQKKFLQSELSRCSSWKFASADKKPKVPAKVRAARTLVNKWDAHCAGIRKRRDREYTRLYSRIRQKIFLAEDVKGAHRLILELLKACGE